MVQSVTVQGVLYFPNATRSTGHVQMQFKLNTFENVRHFLSQVSPDSQTLKKAVGYVHGV